MARGGYGAGKKSLQLRWMYGSVCNWLFCILIVGTVKSQIWG